MTRVWMVVAFVMMASVAYAESPSTVPDHASTSTHAPAEAHATASNHPEADTIAHPQIPHHARWAGVVVLTILGTFIAAAVVGPTVRVLNPPQDSTPPDSHSDRSRAHHTAHH